MRILVVNVNTTESITEAIAKQARAVAAFVPAAVIAILLALLPGFASVSPFSWLFGAAIAGVLYRLLARRQPFYADVSGEAIAVDNVSH